MDLIIGPDGVIKTIYAETINLRSLGHTTVTRASHAEPDEVGDWHANLSPVGGPMLGPFGQRSEALQAELAWLEAHWLNQPGR